MAADRSSGSGSRPRRPAAKKRATTKKRAVSAKGPAAKKKRTGAKKKQALNRPSTSRGARRKSTASRHQKPIIASAAVGWFPQLIRAALVLVLMFLAVFTTITFFQNISAPSTSDSSLWTTAPMFFFAVGLIALPILLWGAPEGMLYLYVLGHELTHVIFIYLCGGKVVGDIRVSLQGGHVITTKTNWLIALSPYFVPFYTVLVGTTFLAASWAVDLGQQTRFTINDAELAFAPIYLLYALIGLTWAMHIYYTLTMVVKDQPDLRMNGTILSLFLIYLVNLTIIVVFIAFASDDFTLTGFAKDWAHNAHAWINQTLVRLARLIW